MTYLCRWISLIQNLIDNKCKQKKLFINGLVINGVEVTKLWGVDINLCWIICYFNFFWVVFQTFLHSQVVCGVIYQEGIHKKEDLALPPNTTQRIKLLSLAKRGKQKLNTRKAQKVFNICYKYIYGENFCWLYIYNVIFDL